MTSPARGALLCGRARNAATAGAIMAGLLLTCPLWGRVALWIRPPLAARDVFVPLTFAVPIVLAAAVALVTRSEHRDLETAPPRPLRLWSTGWAFVLSVAAAGCLAAGALAGLGQEWLGQGGRTFFFLAGAALGVGRVLGQMAALSTPLVAFMVMLYAAGGHPRDFRPWWLVPLRPAEDPGSWAFALAVYAAGLLLSAVPLRR
ncbi:hypothetical protein [Spongiactinospora sp. 9N601]|uniref:hypothetical protein n=1 Tax=Spongiactinospora sp. 9N601 TaxID=3375149 RepID=UPI0037B26ABD